VTAFWRSTPDPDGGDLADRVGRQSAATAADLLATRPPGRYHDIGSYTSINGDNLEALASPDYGTTHREFTGWDWNRLTTTVSPFYNLMLADCGSRLSAPAAAGVLATVSRVVIMAGAS
jgi:MinD-like ATPase involved in chromosome partitioning or flagellar assembly